MLKIIILISLLTLVVSSSASPVQRGFKTRLSKTDELSENELEFAFDELEYYLSKNVDAKDAGGLKAAKKLKPMPGFGETYLQRAAKIYIYLSEFETCEPKAIGYMFDVLRGRQFAEPQQRATHKHGLAREKTRLERLLEGALVRASGKCRSFVEVWFRDTEKKIEPKSKRLLYDLMSHEAIKQRVADRLGETFAERVVGDDNLARKLSGMDYDQLYRFFYGHITDNYIKPCRKYVDVMSAVMVRGSGFGFGYSRWAKTLFDEPSGDFLDSTYRFHRCRFDLGVETSVMNTYTSAAVRRYEQVKKQAP